VAGNLSPGTEAKEVTFKNPKNLSKEEISLKPQKYLGNIRKAVSQT